MIKFILSKAKGFLF